MNYKKYYVLMVIGCSLYACGGGGGGSGITSTTSTTSSNSVATSVAAIVTFAR